MLQREKIHHGSMKQLLFLGEEVPKEEEEEEQSRARAGAGAGEVSKGGAEQELASRVSAHMEFS